MQVANPEIVCGVTEAGLYLHVGGRATHRVCPTMDKLVLDYLAAQPERPVVALDLEGCTWLDSTFSGWLIGLRKRLATKRAGRLLLSRCSPQCRRTLERIRLAELFEYADVTPPKDTQRLPCPGSDQPDRQTIEYMLAAHEALAATDAGNQQTFGPVAEVLRRQLDQKP